MDHTKAAESQSWLVDFSNHKATTIFVSQPFLTTLFGLPYPLHTPQGRRGLATQDRARARDSNTAQGDTQDMEATLANLFRN